ncbi:phosphotransferase [Kribbella sp. NPDC055071]
MPVIQLDADWSAFAREWGVDPELARMEPLTGGLINANYLLTAGERRFVVRSYRRTRELEDIEYELLAVEFLRTAGFPTASPVRSLTGRLFGAVAGHAAAMFEYIDGIQAPSRSGGFGSFDLRLGCEVGGAVGRMHRITWDLDLPVRRAERGDPLQRLDEFLVNVESWTRRDRVPGLEQFIAGVANVATEVASALRPGIPVGLVHGDISERNVLVDADGHLLALLDFDDCVESYRLYDLCSLLTSWGLDEDRRLDVERAAALVTAYTTARPITRAERDVLPGLLMASAGADGCEFIAGVWHRDAFVDGVADSYSVTTFLSLLADPGWQTRLQAACLIEKQSWNGPRAGTKS